MGVIAMWVGRLGRLGNAGAVANAARVCTEQRRTEERLEITLHRLAAAHPAQRTTPASASGPESLRRPA